MDISMTCKGYAVESTQERGGPSCSSKVNVMGLELPRPVDPEVRWKTVNRRQRAARRARTSFGADRGYFFAFGGAINQDGAQDGPPVSESEKLGVSILGRRFSDLVENIPTKKGRFHMDCSPSPSPASLLVDPYENALSSSSRGVTSYAKHRKIEVLGTGKEESKGPFDSDDDFSGISILAAAACESVIDGDILNGACSKLTHPLQERMLGNNMDGSKLSLHGMEEDKSNVLGASSCIYDRPLGTSSSASEMKSFSVTAPTSSETAVEPASALKINCSMHSGLSCANNTEIASDAKSTGAAMAHSSGNPEKTVGCLQVAAVQTEHVNSTRDSRLHWDLNVAMEAWETKCDGDDDSNLATVSNCCDAGNDMDKIQTSQFDSMDAGDLVDHSFHKIDEGDVPKDVNTKDESDSPAGSSSHTLVHQASQNIQLLKSESVGSDTPAETIDLPDQQKSRFASVMESHVGFDEKTSTTNVEKLDGSHCPPIDCDGLSHMSSANRHGGGNSLQTSELGSTMKPLTLKLVYEERTSFTTVNPVHKKVDDFGRSDNKLEGASEQSVSEFKNQELLDIESGASKMDQSVGKMGERDTDVNKSSADTEILIHPKYNPGSSDCDMARVHEEDGADATLNSKGCLSTCANSSSAETSYISGAAPLAPALSSECNKRGPTDSSSIVDSQATAHSYQNGCENVLGKVASNICLEHCYETETSHISRNLAGIGEADVEEDDSQYEDGELRESGCHRYWMDDGYEEVKRANWRYQVSDDKNEAAIPGPPLPIGSVSKNADIPVASYNGTQSRKEDDTVSPVSSRRLWSTNCLDGGSVTDGKPQSIHCRLTSDTQNDINQGRMAVRSSAMPGLSERSNDGLGESTRMKNRGWDMLPEEQKHSRCNPRDGADSSNRCLGTLDADAGDESLRKTGVSNRDVQRVEWPKSFDRPHKSELSRSDDGYGSGSKAERTVDSHRSNGISDASRRIQAGSRGDQWVDISKHPRPTRRKSPEYYDYGPSGPRNAAEAAVAKMESNGFVVAPDGTLVRAVDANAGHVARRMRNASTSSYCRLSGQGSPIDRDGACGFPRGPAHAREVSPERHFSASSNLSGRYGPEFEKSHTADGNLSSFRCSLSIRQWGIPTGRSSLKLSCAHSRSPSGSRSRSPHDWASPRNRRKTVANGGSTSRRHSRSPPNNMAKIRIGRMASPQRQSGYDDRAMRYSSPPRNHTYSQHASTWGYRRNCSQVELSNNNKYSRRSPPPRITSQSDRFGVIDSQGRSRPGEFYRPTQGRSTYGYDRRNKHDGNADDQSEYAGRYGSHSVKPYDRDGAVKQFRSNTGDKFRTRISAPRSPELQRRVSPRRFDRGLER